VRQSLPASRQRLLLLLLRCCSFSCRCCCSCADTFCCLAAAAANLASVSWTAIGWRMDVLRVLVVCAG